MMPRTVVVAHREAMVAEGISAALARYPGIVPVGAASTARDAERLGARAYAVAIDAGLPGARPAAGRLRRVGARVVFLGDAEGEESVQVPTTAPVKALVAALVPGARTVPTSSPRLSTREGEVLKLVAKGLSGRQVATQLGISPKTVERHKTRIFARLGVPNVAAAVFAMREGMEGSYQWSPSTI